MCNNIIYLIRKKILLCQEIIRKNMIIKIINEQINIHTNSMLNQIYTYKSRDLNKLVCNNKK